jgi:hypothetical protein
MGRAPGGRAAAAGPGRGRRLRSALAGLALLGPTAAGAGPTDIARVDELIGAPRARLGRTGAEVERALGPPRETARVVVPTYLDPRVFLVARRLRWPGLAVDVLESGRIRRVLAEGAGLALPAGLAVGRSREDVEAALGEAQRATDGLLLYLHSDGYPETVRFHLRDGVVQRIEWDYGSAE